LDEQELLKTYRDTRDPKYFAQLYEPFMPLVYGSCLKYFKNEADAQDAVMDLYVKLTQKALTHKIEYFKSWLFVVTRNYCFEVLRKRNVHSDKEKEAAVMYSEEVFHPDNVDQDAHVRLLQECMDQLDDFQKSCVELFYYKKMSYMAISEQLELKFNQVRSRIQNGRRNLKICMESKAKQEEIDLF